MTGLRRSAHAQEKREKRERVFCFLVRGVSRRENKPTSGKKENVAEFCSSEFPSFDHTTTFLSLLSVEGEKMRSGDASG
jgi:hypothetical protein